MKRDMDLIRQILLKVENDAPPMGLLELTASDFSISHPNLIEAVLFEHVLLLVDAGYFARHVSSLDGPSVGNLSMGGYDFLDSVRDQGVWQETKDVATAAGGFTMDLLKLLAVGFIKKQVEERTGVKL